MTCPDIDQLLELAIGGDFDPENEVHARQCKECSADLRLVREARAAYGPIMAVPESLIDASVEAVFAIGREQAAKTPSPSTWDLVAAAALGSLTLLFVIVGTGSVGGAGGSTLLPLALIAGAASAAYEFRLGDTVSAG